MPLTLPLPGQLLAGSVFEVTGFPGLTKEVRPMTSSANIDDFTLFRSWGPVIATVPPGRDPRPVSGPVWLLIRPRVITRWQETSRG